MLLNVTNDFLYYDTRIDPIHKFHRPYFLALGGQKKRDDLSSILKPYWDVNSDLPLLQSNSSHSRPLSHIVELGEVEANQSFSRPGTEQNVFKVFLDESRYVPAVSDHLFFKHDLFTAEHDIPYIHRAASDLAAQGNWLLDSDGKERTLKVLCYDIETPQFERYKNRSPVEIIGLTQFDVRFSSYHDLDKEEFHFDLSEISGNWKDDEIFQLQAKGGENEVESILELVNWVEQSHVISGHNIISFDNNHIYHRIKHFLEESGDTLSNDNRLTLTTFIQKRTRPENLFTYGKKSLGVNFHPISLDTYHGALRFYRFLDSFDLKSLARFLGIHIESRVYIRKNEMASVGWDKLMEYSGHDVKEQAGITRIMLQQALPLAFSTGMPMEALMSAGATKVWDYMTMIRGAKQKKIIPATCRAHGVSSGILRLLKKNGLEDPNAVDVKTEFVKAVRSVVSSGNNGINDTDSNDPDATETVDKELIRVVKYGDEMPDWVNYPYLAFNSRRGGDKGQDHGYHLPGGMTIQPQEVASEFIPWWHMIVADVGAMYPTILKGMNIGADTVRLAKQGEDPDDWIWLKFITEDFLQRQDVHYRSVLDSPEEKYADKGHLIGVKYHPSEGLVNQAMTGILNMIYKIKNELKERGARGEDTRTLKMMYNSLKGMRNAGTHGILVASNVSCRQFNLWGGAAITTTGQRMLQDAMDVLKDRGMRVVYGDTDGIYVGCARSSMGIPEVCNAFGVTPTMGDYISDPEDVLKVIGELNWKWRKRLNYEGFELEPEYADCMMFVKHKNYLIWNTKNGALTMNTKGNNFKGSDKAPVARIVLQEIMARVLKEHQVWQSEMKVKESIKMSIKKHTLDYVEKLDMESFTIENFTLIQTVRPPKFYKERGGTESALAIRSRALGELLGKEIRSSAKFRFLVLKHPLKGIANPTKTGIRPIDYMWPIELVTNYSNIDLDWYREMILNYVKGAFGLREMERTTQIGLDNFL